MLTSAINIWIKIYNFPTIQDLAERVRVIIQDTGVNHQLKENNIITTI